jgi:hypothetical protein
MEQAGTELRQAQCKLVLAKTAFPDVHIVFVFPVLNKAFVRTRKLRQITGMQPL